MTVLAVGSVSDKICRYASSIMPPASPPGTPEATGNDGNKQVSLIITKSHQVPRRKTKHGYILLTATQKKGLQGSGQE